MMQTRSDSSPVKAPPQTNLDLSSTTSGEGLDVSLNSSSGSIYPPPPFYQSPYSRTVKIEPKEESSFSSPSFQSPQETQTYYPKPDLPAMGYSMNSGQQNTASMFMAAAAYAYAAGCQNQMDYNWQSTSRYPNGYQPFYPYDSHSYHNNGPEFSAYQRSFASADERTRECVNCGVVEASVWKMDENGLYLCNDCYRAHKGTQSRTTDHEPASTEEVDESQKSLSSQASSLNFLEHGAAEKEESYRSRSFEDYSSLNSGTSSKTGANSSNRKPTFRRNALVCSNCATTQTTLWRRNLEAQPVCNACGLYQKLHGRTRPVTMRKDSIQTRKRKSKKRRDLESANSNFVQEALASGVVDPTKILSAGFDFSTCTLSSSLANRSSAYLSAESNPLIDQLNPFTANALGKMTYKFDDSVMKSFNPFDMLLSSSASNGTGKLPNPYTASYANEPSWLSASSSEYDLRKATTLTKPPNFPPDLIDSPLNF